VSRLSLIIEVTDVVIALLFLINLDDGLLSSLSLVGGSCEIIDVLNKFLGCAVAVNGGFADKLRLIFEDGAAITGDEVDLVEEVDNENVFVEVDFVVVLEFNC
jgi:hypothetical protein